MTSRGHSTEGEAGTGSRPVLGSNFLVDFGNGKANQGSGGFTEVIFPEFRIGIGEVGLAAAPLAMGLKPSAAGHTLILKRGIWGALDLYAWWDKARNGKAPRGKTLRIMLLGQDQRTVVLTWTFHKVRPVALSYSPLRAQESEVAMETVEFAFDGFELS